MRRKLIEQIQENRKSKLISYITGDRQLVSAMIAEDAVRPLYDQLLTVGKSERIAIDLFPL